jgi:hypothetical protein
MNFDLCSEVAVNQEKMMCLGAFLNDLAVVYQGFAFFNTWQKNQEAKYVEASPDASASLALA